ncbi:hypothetical protein N7U49_06900 [Streptomyces sp. AD2-2]|nr:hypothetical protein N7U49_06900 [Streptomyces sp. AD2-2]
MSLGYDDRPVVARSAATTGLPGVPAATADVTDALDGRGITRTALRAPVLSPPGHGEGRYAPRLAVRLVDAVKEPRQRAGVGARDRGVFDLTVRQVRRHGVQTAVEPQRSARAGPGCVGLGSSGVSLRGSFAGRSEQSHRAAAPGLPRGPSDGVPAVPASAVPPQPG